MASSWWFKQTSGSACCLPTLCPAPCWGLELVKKLGQWTGEKGSPETPPTAHACPCTHMYMHTHFCPQTHFPPFLFTSLSSQFHSSLSSFSHSLSSFPLLFLVSSFICVFLASASALFLPFSFLSPFLAPSFSCLLYLPSCFPPQSFPCPTNPYAPTTHFIFYTVSSLYIFQGQICLDMQILNYSCLQYSV